MKHYFDTYWDEDHRLWHCHCACGAGSYGMTIDEAQANAGATMAMCTREAADDKAQAGEGGADQGVEAESGPYHAEAHPDQEADTQGF